MKYMMNAPGGSGDWGVMTGPAEDLQAHIKFMKQGRLIPHATHATHATHDPHNPLNPLTTPTPFAPSKR